MATAAEVLPSIQEMAEFYGLKAAFHKRWMTNELIRYDPTCPVAKESAVCMARRELVLGLWTPFAYSLAEDAAQAVKLWVRPESLEIPSIGLREIILGRAYTPHRADWVIYGESRFPKLRARLLYRPMLAAIRVRLAARIDDERARAACKSMRMEDKEGWGGGIKG